MFSPLPRQATRPPAPGRHTGARRGRLAAAVTAAICGLLASAVTIPAAFAMVVPARGGPSTASPVAPVPATTRVITVAGMAGWQITLIAIGAALAAAAATFVLDRALAARRAAPVASA